MGPLIAFGSSLAADPPPVRPAGIDMLIECNCCEAVVDGKLLAEHESYNERDDPSPFTAYLLECPRCKGPLLAGSYAHEDDPPSRYWPSPRKYFSWYIPDIIRASLEEAEKCFQAGAYLSCAVMSGRSLEGICRQFKTKSQYLGGGLQELKQRGVIDARLFEWSEALKVTRNAAAHATAEVVSKEDARDLLDLVTAICEYVFVLTVKFNEFQKRRATPKPPKASKSGPA